MRSLFDDEGDGARRDVRELRYLLDGVGNRREVVRELRVGDPETVAYGVNALNQYVAVAGVSRAHSASGNLLDDGRFRYDYDYKNRIVRVRRAADDAVVARYRYDTDNRRVVKQVHDPATGALASTTRVIYDGWREVEEQDAAGRTLCTYVHGPTYVDEVLQLTRTADHPLGAGSFYLHQDARGNVVAVTDAAGAVVERRVFDDYGQAYDEARQPAAQSGVGNAFGFQGRRLDPETGLYYFRNRCYDPGTGRFLQRDPVWDPGNLGNSYTFAWNDPGSLVDPTGEFAFMVIFSTAATGFLYGIANSLQDDLYRGEPFDKVKALEEGFMGALVGGGFGAGIVAFGFGAGAFGGVAGLFKAASFAFSAAQFAQGGADMVYGLQTGNGAMAARGAWDAATAFAGGRLGAVAMGVDLLGDGGEEEDFDNCFLAGHVTETTNRGAVPIEEVRLKDRIAPPPGHENCPDPKCGEVENLFRNWTDQVVTITAVTRPKAREHRAASRDGGEAGEEDGEPPSSESSQTIRCTPGHPFFVVGRGYVFAGDLRAGDEFEARGVPVVVARIEVKAERAETFNFEVRCHHTYRIAEREGEPAVLVHNISARALRRWGRSQARINDTIERLGRRALRQSGGDWRKAERTFERYLGGVENRLRRAGSKYGIEIQPAALPGGRRVPNFIHLHRGGVNSPLIADAMGNPRIFAYPGSRRLDAALIDRTRRGSARVRQGYDITLDANKADMTDYYMEAFPHMRAFHDIR